MSKWDLLNSREPYNMDDLKIACPHEVLAGVVGGASKNSYIESSAT